MRRLDIAVAGCGPAGLAAALLLRRAGHRVTIFERFETPRPIGAGLMIQPTGLAVLRALGLDAQVLAAGARIDRLYGESVSAGRVVLDVRYAAMPPPEAFGIGIHRSALFDILHQAAGAADIAFASGHEIAGSDVSGSGRRLTFAGGGNSDPFDLVVDALGTRSALAPPAGRDLAYGALWATVDWPGGAFDRTALEQRYQRASIMAGLLPLGALPAAGRERAALFWSLRADRLDAWHDAGLDAWQQDVLAVWPALEPVLAQITSPAALTFARYAHRTLPAPAERAMIHIGDAWHSASPQLGQGANMALLDAYALAVGLANADDVADGLARAVRLRRRHVRLYQALTAIFTPVYQSDSRLIPLVRDRLVGPLSRLWPATWLQAALVSGLVGAPLDALGLSRDAG